jgi:hypothetical protein
MTCCPDDGADYGRDIATEKIVFHDKLTPLTHPMAQFFGARRHRKRYGVVWSDGKAAASGSWNWMGTWPRKEASCSITTGLMVTSTWK